MASRVYLFQDGKKKVIISKESFKSSILSDTYTFLVSVALLFITNTYFGNNVFALFMMFMAVMMIRTSAESQVMKKEDLIKLIEKEF